MKMTIRLNSHKKTILTLAGIGGIIGFFVVHPSLLQYAGAVALIAIGCFIAFLVYQLVYDIWEHGL